ncbi:MAG: glutathione S-transferase N-terminal domain-containing protein [Thiohalocapsa sp.]
MLLRHSHTSPYVRKVTVLLHETGLVDQVRVESVDGWSEPDALTADNPLSMVPTLVLDDGSTLFDSPVICEYLDSLHAGPPLIPENLPGNNSARWRVLREQALADGILDCAILIFLEQHRRPEAMRWGWWLDLKRRAITRALDQLERDADQMHHRVDLGTIAIAVALGYLDLRGAAGDWREQHPALAGWFTAFAQRPSMLATEPPR